MATKKKQTVKEEEGQAGQVGQDGRRTFNTRLNDDLLLEIKIRCLRERIGVNDAIEALFQAWLDDKVELNFNGAKK
jgi:hypothetical protein